MRAQTEGCAGGLGRARMPWASDLGWGVALKCPSYVGKVKAGGRKDGGTGSRLPRVARLVWGGVGVSTSFSGWRGSVFVLLGLMSVAIWPVLWSVCLQETGTLISDL